MEHKDSHTEEQSLKPDIVSHGDNPVHDGALGSPVILSKYIKALITNWIKTRHKASLSPNRLSVSQSVSFLAFLYEKMRNAVDFKEEHLIRKAAIERIVKRRMVLNENGRDIAELVIRELLWARYYENNTIGDDKVRQVQTTIDKYFFLRNELSSTRSGKEQEQIGLFMLEVISCEIEEILSPEHKKEAFINFVYQLLRNHIAPFDGNSLEKDIQVYIAVERSFAHNDNALIRYHLLKLMIPEITEITWKSADRVLPKLYDVYNDIEKALVHPLADKTRNFINKQGPPFFILRDIFNANSANIESILSNEGQLKHKVDDACRKRYDETKDRLRRTGVRSFIYIILTKVVFAFILEVPYDLYIMQSISYVPIIVNVIFPPLLMSIIILSVTVPGDENTKKIFSLIKDILSEDPDDPEMAQTATVIGKVTKSKNPLYTAVFTLLYLLTYLLSFGSIVYVLTLVHFNPVSQIIFIFFVTLVTFFAFRVINITREYLVVDRDGPLTPFIDLFFIPIIRVGQWLSGEVLSKFNVFIFVFDFIIEMPLKVIVEIIDEWARFVRLKKEEMV